MPRLSSRILTDADRPGPAGELTPRRPEDWLPRFFTAASFPVPLELKPETPVPCPFAQRQTVATRAADGTERILVTCDWLAQRTGAPSGVTDGICERCMAAGLPANNHPVLEDLLDKHMLARIPDGDRTDRYQDRPLLESIDIARRRGIPDVDAEIYRRVVTAAARGTVTRQRLRDVLFHINADAIPRESREHMLVIAVAKVHIPAAEIESLREDLGI